MPAALCAGRLSITTISLRLRVGARHCLTYARNLAPFIEPSTVHGARMPLRRSAATKVMVFQWPCGTRPISLSPRGQRPLSRTILVLAAVSSTKTRWAGSNMPCSRIQRWRARATSARSCSAACRLFFESDVVMLEEAPHRAAAARNLVPVHRQNRLVQGQVWPSRNQTQQKICMLLQRRDAPAPRLSRTAARLPKALDPDNRRAGTDIKLLGRRAPRRPAFNFRNHSRPHVFRIGLRHRPASQNRINADRLSHPSPSENLLDSIGTEHALAGAGFGAMVSPPGAGRQIDVAMPDFGGANRERCVSYFTLRRLSKKCNVAKKTPLDSPVCGWMRRSGSC